MRSMVEGADRAPNPHRQLLAQLPPPPVGEDRGDANGRF